VKDGDLKVAEARLADARKGGASEADLAKVRETIAARRLVARAQAAAPKRGGLRVVKAAIAEAQAAGLQEARRDLNRALKAAREAAEARFAQACPVADDLAKQGFAPVVGDGRVYVWKTQTSNGHDPSYVLDRVIILDNRGVWVTRRPKNRVVADHARARRIERARKHWLARVNDRAS